MLLALLGIALASVLLRLLLVALVEAPTVFNDELGYMKLAQSIGLDGRLALLDHEGLSYSPLYPTLLAPFYALGASAPAVYALARVANALLISLAVFPIYKLARFALPRREALLATALSALAPLMSYASFTLSENLAYPLALAALWAMTAAVRTPGLRADAVLLATILVATAARVQLIVLLPAALTAALLTALVRREESVGRRLRGALADHVLLFGLTAAVLLVAGIRALAGGDVYSVFGRYANVGRAGFPDPGKVVELAFHHLAGLDLAVGVVPFVGALVAGYAFVRAGLPRAYLPFAAVALSFTCWLILEVAIDAAQFDSAGADVPRIHERFLIYAVPLFLVAVLAAVRMRPGSGRTYLAAGIVAALLPAAIPFATYVNRTNGVDTFSLIPFGRDTETGVDPLPLTPLAAVWVAGTLAWIYARMFRHSARGVAGLVAVVFVYVSGFVWVEHHNASTFARSFLPAHADWVDRASPGGDVVLVAGAGSVPALETAFHNTTIARVYTLCRVTFGPDFGERQVAADGAVHVRETSEPVVAAYAVVPARLGVLGRVVARNPEGGQVLVAPAGGRLALRPGAPPQGCR